MPIGLFNNDFNFTYRSDLRYLDHWGKGWDFNYASRAFEDEDTVLILDGAGSVRRYMPSASGGVYAPENGVFRELEVASAGAITVRYPNGSVIEYHPFGGALSGRLSRIEDRDGNTRTLEYDETGRLTGVMDSQAVARPAVSFNTCIKTRHRARRREPR